MRINKKYFLAITCVILAVLMVTLSAIVPVGAIDTANKISPESKIDSALKEKMETASPDEKISVAIWYEDVDQNQIDTLTAEKVGFTEEEISESYEMPSTSLLSDLKAEKEGADDEMVAYLKRTEKHREKERKRTDEYIMTRREFSRNKYKEKSSKLIKDLSLKETDVTFQSQYAPMVIANLSVSEIESLKSNLSIISISYYEDSDMVNDSVTTASESTNLSLLKNNHTGLDGEGVKVGVIDDIVRVTNSSESGLYIVPDNYPPEIRYSQYNTKLTDYGNVVVLGDEEWTAGETHGDGVSNTLLAVAPEITIYSASLNYLSYRIAEVLITEGVQIISISKSDWIPETSDEYAYSIAEKWFDHIVAMHGVTVVKSASNYGNETSDRPYIDSEGKEQTVPGPRVGSPGLAYNVITVGAYQDEYDPDSFWYKTSYKNSIVQSDGDILIGCEKPDVVMPNSLNGGGTSNATPYLSGIIALMIELKPSLAMYPQAMKAIVLASCHRKTVQTEACGGQETMEQGITDRQGAGAPDAWTMACIVCEGTYGVGRFIGTRTQAIRRFVMPKYNANNMNVSITWIKENTYDRDNHSSFGSVIEGDYVDLNLSVYRNGTEVGSSELAKSSTEMAYFSLNNESDYEIRINKATTSYTDVVRYGYAYSVDKPYDSPVDEEGIYYIRNYYSDKYLTLNTDTNETSMQNLASTADGRKNQMWILSGTEDDYELLPAYGADSKKINFGSQVGSNPYYKAVLGTNDLNLSIGSWENDTNLEPDAYVFKSSANSNNILSYTGTTGIFVRSSSEPVVNMYRMWVLEDINYRFGDVNMDGVVSVSDVSMIERATAVLITLNNVESYLADCDFDGRVTVKDKTVVQRIIAELLSE